MKKIQFFIPIALILVFLKPGISALPQEISFNAEGKLRIVQFTDIHWESGRPNNAATLANMEAVLDQEKPDLVVLTGDIVTSGDPELGWKEITAPMAKRKILWTATLGNHDSEGDTPRNQVYSIIRNLPYCVTVSQKNVLGGINDFNLEVKSKSGEVKSVLYFFDSNEYSTPDMPGDYGWIELEQIQWYKKTSERYAKSNGNKPLPALAFFHIPLPEYHLVQKAPETIGHNDEGVCSPVINSGMFAAMVQQKDVMGTFVGHDHNNDFIGSLYDIALAYGRCSGNNGYGSLRLGARVIDMYEGKFRFDTWIATPGRRQYEYTHPMGISFDFNENDLLPSVEISDKLKQGLSYTYYEGKVESVNEIEQLKPVEKGVVNNFDISIAKTNDHFAIKFEGFIHLSENDMYKFHVLSDDGAVLYIDGKEVVNNDGGHSPRLKKGIIGLKKGYHKIEMLYFEDYMGNALEVGIEGITMRKNKILDNMLFTK